MKKTDDSKIIEALRALARDIQSDDGVANAALEEAANRVAELVAERDEVRKDFGAMLDKMSSGLSSGNHWREYVLRLDNIRRQLIAERDEARCEQNADERICAQRDQAIKERDEARSTLVQAHNHLMEAGVPNIELDLSEQIKWLADKRDQAIKELATEAAKVGLLQDSLKYTPKPRPEPSRLEIAARAMQGMFASDSWNVARIPTSALEYADKLIAAAKEVAK